MNIAASIGNTFIGQAAGKLATSSYSTCIGHLAGDAAMTNGYNTYVGQAAGGATSSGQQNIAMGNDAGSSITTGSYNTMLGYGTNVGTNSHHRQIAIGRGMTTTASDTFVLGYGGKTLLHGEYGTASQTKLGINLGTTYVAPSATLHVKGQGATNATISFQVDSSLKNLMKLYDDGATIRIGSNAGYSGGAAAGGIYIGASAGWYPTGGSSVAIGYGAYQGTSAGNSAQCVAIGNGTLRYVIDARFNTALGYNAGNALTDGDSNTLLGHTAGDNLTTGGNNIIIGKGVDASAIDVDDEINIGDHIIGSMVSSDLYTKFVGQTYGDLYTQADGVTIVPNFKNGNTQTVELGGNRAIDNPTNIKVGATYLIIIKQDATGSRTVTWGSNYKFPGGTAPTLTTTADQADVITMIAYNASILMCTSTLDFATS
jgi:hypothetical protein